MKEIQKICENGTAYFKPVVPDDKPDSSDTLILDECNAPFFKVYNDELIIAFLVDEGPDKPFRYILNRYLTEEGISPEQMYESGIRNLEKRAMKGINMQAFESGVSVLMLDGNFEASLLLLDVLWDEMLRDKVENGYIVAIPARDSLAFCDSKAEAAISSLKGYCSAISKAGDHLLTNTLYQRISGRWEKYTPDIIK